MATLHDPDLCRRQLEHLANLMKAWGKPLRFMEVCGTHTVAIFRGGLRSLLPENIIHLSGPGCPVCVTHDAEIAEIITLAGKKEVIIATFGDLMRVPGPSGRTLKHAQAEGARIEVVYSPIDALTLARSNPDSVVLFPGIGFETTAPAIAGTVLMAERQNIDNFAVLSCHKLVPPVLEALLTDTECNIDAFLLPGHVSTILGLAPYEFVANRYARPAVIAGFEPADILDGLCRILTQLITGTVKIENAYPRAVHENGNPQARSILERVFDISDARWRGIGNIPQSGLDFSAEYKRFDARKRFALDPIETQTVAGCKCGEILRGRITPDKCPLFGKVCTPLNPIGPCMVSTEGSCAAYYKYAL